MHLLIISYHLLSSLTHFKNVYAPLHESRCKPDDHPNIDLSVKLAPELTLLVERMEDLMTKRKEKSRSSEDNTSTIMQKELHQVL